MSLKVLRMAHLLLVTMGFWACKVELTISPICSSAPYPTGFLVHMGLIQLHLMSYGALVSASNYYEKRYFQSAELRALTASGLVASN